MSARQPVTRDADRHLLIDVAQAALARLGGQRWSVRPSPAWCHVTSPDHVSREHGWKLHVSATPLSSPIVLARAMEVLVRGECTFKFGTDLSRVAQLNSSWYDRGGGGKFITAYPRDDVQLRTMAAELHEATLGLAGPEILSDRPFVPGSLVHYRYGVFAGRSDFTDDGLFVSRITGPDGSRFKDERQAWFTPPGWAESPFGEGSSEASRAPASVLLAGRFSVSEAIRHANKGGVYRAIDVTDGSEVIVKQARAQVGARLDGQDVRDLLRGEAGILDALAPLSVTPRKVLLFEQQGDLFLAEELIPGVSLSRWASEGPDDPGRGPKEVLSVIRGLVAMVQEVHRAGYVIRDLKPQNVMVTPAGELRLIDVEFVLATNRPSTVAGTNGFLAPEHRGELGAVTLHLFEASADCFALGVTIFCALTALPPLSLAAANETPRSRSDRTFVLGQVARDHPVVEEFSSVILGLTEVSPDDRWTLERADVSLAELEMTAATGVFGRSLIASACGELPLERLDRLIGDSLTYLRRTMTPQEKDLWRSDVDRDGDRDPVTAWCGAAGVVAALTRAARAGQGEGRIEQTVADACEWIGQRLPGVPRTLPGLAYGRAGTAWALYDAAVLLNDEPSGQLALDLVKRLPTRWASPDITHGLAGAGMAHLHLGDVTGDAILRTRTVEYVDSVLAAARVMDGNWSWPTPEGVDSRVAGVNVYGYAHGVAGVGAFLLGAAAMPALSVDVRDRCVEAARGAGDTLVRAVRIAPDGRVSWPTAVGGDAAGSSTEWCGGPSGVGGFLLRLAGCVPDRGYLQLAQACAGSVMRNPWRLVLGACCGLAGAGHFLLDLAECSGDQQYMESAKRLGVLIDAQHQTVDGLRLPLPISGVTGYGFGLAGVLDYLVRLRHGGAAPWTPRNLAVGVS